MDKLYRSNFSLSASKRCLLGAMAVLVALMSLMPLTSDAKSRRNKASEDDADAPQQVEVDKRKTRKMVLSFKQMGAWGSIRLQGVDGTQGLSFPIRSDEVVVGAKLRLAYDYSPALMQELSHLTVGLNERIAAIINLPRDKSVGNSRDIELDPRLFRDNNVLEFKLVGHYAQRCEDPYHSSLWLVLSDLGRLELTLAPVSQSSDLKKLPNPFFDRREQSQLSVPMVFPRSPSMGSLQAAGLVASWFGMQTPNRGMQFPVSYGELPEGHAVVFLKGGESIAGVRAAAAPSLTLVPHPADSRWRLLVISGNDEADQMRAARALALNAHALAGSHATVAKEVEAAPRKPYDAPAWLPTDRPVHLGEIVPSANLRVHSYYPDAIRVNYRISPDTFVWHTPGTPLDLRIRATRLPWQRNSSLNIGLNSNFLQTLALNQPVGGSVNDLSAEGPAVRQVPVLLPPYPMQGREQLQMTFHFDVLRNGECAILPPANLEAAIDAESTLDFSPFPHYAAMPNLGYFSNLGYPYTRLADLADTAVVLSEAPAPEEIALYLAVMGRMGESTGYPALRHTLTTVPQIDKVSGKDLIVIQSALNQSLMAKWKDAMPMVVADGDRHLREPRKAFRTNYQWGGEDQTRQLADPGSMNLSSNDGLATIMGFESPLKSGRSVVFFYADKAAHLRKITDALVDFDRSPQIQGDLVVVDDKLIQYTRVADTYYVGDLPWQSKLRWFLADQPLVFALLAVLLVLVLGVLAYRPLRRLVERRHLKT